MPRKRSLGGLKRKLAAMPKKKKLLLLGIVILALALAALLVLFRLSDGAPKVYEIGNDQVAALPLDDGGKLVEKSEIPGEEDGPVGQTYTYADLPTAGGATGGYVELLTGEDAGFALVDAAGFPTEDKPDFQAEKGQAILAKPSAEEGKLCRVTVTWSPEECVVSVTQAAEPVTVETDPMTMRGAVEYLQGRSPAELGLDGGSMAEYMVYPNLGVVYVDGAPCVELDVYEDNSTATSAILGTYFLAADNTLYKLNRATGEVERLLEQPQ